MKAKQEQYMVRCMRRSEAVAMFRGMDLREVYGLLYWSGMCEAIQLSNWSHAILAGCKLAVSPTAAMKVTCDLYKRRRR